MSHEANKLHILFIGLAVIADEFLQNTGILYTFVGIMLGYLPLSLIIDRSYCAYCCDR